MPINKNKNEIMKKSKTPDTELSGNLNPAETPANLPVGKANLNTSDVEFGKETNHMDIDAANLSNQRNSLKNTSTEENISQNLEFGNMNNTLNPKDSLKNIGNKGATEYAGELTGFQTNDLNQTGFQPDFSFEFGDWGKKPEKPNNQKNK